MKKVYAFCTAFLVFSSSVLFAQNNRKVSGLVTDTSKTAIAGATVMLIFNKDTLRTVATQEGSFIFTRVNVENFKIDITAQGYKSFTSTYVFGKNERQLRLEPIRLNLDEKMLREVVIKAKPNPVRFMQDTVEYNAAAFNVLDGDNVADLLKQFPGMEVDEHNNVKTMGTSLVKLRVNGKDFFTNNIQEFIGRLPAGIVSKIQVIDDYGDQANFIGIKTGEPTKMLNIVTKPGMNKGNFGTASTSAGTNNLLGANVIGNLWNDDKQGGASASMNTLNNGAGNTKNMGLSLNYRDKIGENSSGGIGYGFVQNINASAAERAVETINPLGNFISNSLTNGESKSSNHNVNGSFTLKSKKNFLNASIGASYNDGENNNSSFNEQSGVIRQDLRNKNQSAHSSPRINANVNLSRILTNKKNSFSANLSFNSSRNNADQNISTNTVYYDKNTGALLKDSVLNRNLVSRGSTSDFGFGFNYSLGLKKRTKDSLLNRSLNLTYSGNISRNDNVQSTFVYDNLSDRVSFVDSLSSNTKSVAINQLLGLSYNYSRKNFRYNLGINARPNFLSSNYVHLDKKITNNTFNYAPNVNLSKTLSKGKTISVNYSGNSINPTIFQLQPLRNTQNLQNIVIGNPNLNASFSHNINANFNYAASKSGLSLQTGLNFSTVRREIVNNVMLVEDTLNSLKQITRFENVSGSYNIGSNYYLSIPVVKSRFTINYSGNLGISRRAVFLNNDKVFNSGLNFSQRVGGSLSVKKFSLNLNLGYSQSNNNTVQLLNNFSEFQYIGLGQVSGAAFFKSQSLRADMTSTWTTKKLSLRVGTNFSATHNNNTSASNFNDIRTLDLSFSGRMTIRKSYYLNFNSTKRINSGYTFANSNPLLISAGLSKNFFKDQSLSLTVNGTDLLNQANNITRSIAGNSIIDSRSNQPTRIFSIGLSYNLSKFGGKNFRINSY